MKNNHEFSREHLLFLKSQRRSTVFVNTMRMTILIAFLLIWELLARYSVIDSFLMSSPTRVASTIKNLIVADNLWIHVGTTLFETVAGFLIATALGTAVAVALWWSESLRKICEPYLIVLNSLPKIALGPIIIVWFGSGIKSIIFMAIIITVIVTVITMQNAFLSTDKGKIMLLKSMGATKLQILSKLVIPSSLKSFISCLKINVGMAWIGSIMGEYLTSRQGIGYLIVYGGQVFKLDLVMASTFILCLLAGAMYALVALLEKVLIKEK
ncbi:MAG: ABC transporter permease [Clostridia bacterium]|nr:ABC transporter permease [Clostridia bacterium]